LIFLYLRVAEVQKNGNLSGVITMRKPVLTIFYQYDPWNASIGGIQTLINSFIKYAPQSFRLRFVGVTADPALTPGRWHEMALNGRDLLFMPLFYLANDNLKQRIPTSVRYTSALLRRQLSSDFMHFHRLEPTLASLAWQGEKTLFIHNDIRQQLQSGDRAILWGRFPQLYYGLERTLVTQFDHILSCNSESANWYQTQYPKFADRTAVIKNSVDTETFYPLSPEQQQQQQIELAQRLGRSPGTRFVLFAGRLHPQKDPILLLQSFAALADPNVHLLIAGQGELWDQVTAEIERLELGDRVSQLGALNRTETAALHQVASAFILTSQYEGLPVTVLEALACGTPIVTTRCGETPHLLQPGSGLVCDERSPDAIAQTLRQVLAQGLDQPKTRAACLEAVRPYSAKQVVGQVYEQMWQRWCERIVPIAVGMSSNSESGRSASTHASASSAFTSTSTSASSTASTVSTASMKTAISAPEVNR
jgi:glycosyltransferase involved in cell wall biosynthesis